MFSLIIISGCKKEDTQIVKNEIEKIKPIDELTFGSQYSDINSANELTWCEKGCSVILIMSWGLYEQLQSEINRFADDISDDIKAPVYIELFDLKDNPNNIRAKILELDSQRKLQGVIFFDAPIVLRSFTAPNGIEYGAYDFCYTDLIYNVTFSKTPKGYICNYHNIKSGSSTTLQMWYSRILPPGENKIEQLSSYLDRNHDYRKGKLNFNQGSLIYADQEFSINSDDPKLLTLYFGGKDVLYQDSEINLIQTNSNDNKRNEYLKSLKNSNELLILNQHGAPVFHNYDINVEDIKNIKPNILGYLFYSCNVGAFHKDDYLAGRYIFSGNGLIAIAHSTPIRTNVGPDGPVEKASDATPYKLYALLEKGASFGESWLFAYNSIPGSLLGDPTIRLRERKIADFSISQNKINLDTINKLYEINLVNNNINELRNLQHPFTFDHPYEHDLIEMELSLPGKISKNSEGKVMLGLEKQNGHFKGRQPLIFVGDDGYSIQFLEITD